MMTNAEFLKEVMLSDMSDEAKALALTVLTNSKGFQNFLPHLSVFFGHVRIPQNG